MNMNCSDIAMNTKNSASKGSPLDQIYQAEKAIASEIANARSLSEQRVNKARIQAAYTKKTAIESGRQEKEAHYQKLLARTEKEAKEIISKAQLEAQNIEKISLNHINAAMRMSVSFILGLNEESS